MIGKALVTSGGFTVKQVGSFVSLMMLLIVPPVFLPSASQAAQVGAEVLEALRLESSVRVMITFDVPRPPALTQGQFLVSPAGQTAVAKGRDRLLEAIPVGEFVLLRQFVTVNAVAGNITARGLEHVQRLPAVVRLDLDTGGHASLAESVPLSKFDAVHALGANGEGSIVAVIDSGYDSNHPDLADDLSAEQCFCSGGIPPGCCPDGSATQGGPGSAEDDNGHGTNVSGIVTSKGVVAPLGAAPESGIVAVKVLAQDGSFCCSSDVVAGLDWVAVNYPAAAAINASLGTSVLFSGDCDNATSFTIALATAVDNLRALGVPVFASSGNNLSGTEMSAPACVANTLSVGAVYDSDFGSSNVFCLDATTAADKVTCFSNSNSSTDLFAPGAAITSTGLGGGTSTYWGTSQASPHAAACSALLRQIFPELSVDDLEAALEASPVLVTDPKNGLSFPRLDCQHALEQGLGLVFFDGFESGDTSIWSTSVQ